MAGAIKSRIDYGKKEKIHLEYLLNATSKSILWTAISTPTGLEGWFADKVQSDDKTVTFFWGKTEKRDAEIIAVRAYLFYPLPLAG